MNQTMAIRLWAESVCQPLGEEVDKLTALGGAALALGVGIYYYDVSSSIENKKKVSGFLREWADAVEGNGVT